jgi:YHS domain-containing protein
MKPILISITSASLLLSACNPAKTAATSATVPPEKCIVSGETLGEMGKPYEYVYQGQPLKFCCKNCVPTFEKDPAKYLPAGSNSVPKNP